MSKNSLIDLLKADPSNEEVYEEWTKFYIRNSMVFTDECSIDSDINTMEEARDFARSDWAGMYHVDSHDNVLDDGFNPFHPLREEDRIIERSFYEAPPVAVLAPWIRYNTDHDPQLPYEVQMHLVGAEFDNDMVWAARIWDKQNNCEVPRSRFFCEALSLVMEEIYNTFRRLIPGFGDADYNAQYDRQKDEEGCAADGVAQINFEDRVINAPIEHDESGVPTI